MDGPGFHIPTRKSGSAFRGCGIVLGVAAVLLLLFVPPGESRDEADESGNPELRYQEIQKELVQERDRIKVLLREESSLLTELDRLERLLTEHRAELRRLTREGRELGARIEDTTAKIDVTSTRLERQRELLRARLQGLYRQHRAGDIAALISAEDYQSLIEKARFLGYLTHADTLLISGYRDLVAEMKSLNETLSKARLDVERNALRVRLKQKEFEKDRENREFLLSRVRTSKSHSERLVRELEEAAVALKEMIERAAKEAALLPPGTPFDELKGKLRWPVKGKIVSRFGRQNDPLFDTPVFKNGIEILAEEDAAVYPVHGGVVAYADWFKGFGQLVIVNHGSGYHTLYANLAQMFVSPGDVVTRDGMIARVSDSDTYRGSSLYFELRHKGKPVDPAQWLVRAGR